MAVSTGTIVVKVATKVSTDENLRNLLLSIILAPFIIVTIVISSPLGIYFSSANEVDILTICNGYFQELEIKVENELNDPNYDEVNLIVMGSETNTLINNITDVICIFASKDFASKTEEQVFLLDDNDLNTISELFWQMNVIEIKTYERIEIEIVTSEQTYIGLDGIEYTVSYDEEVEKIIKVKDVIVTNYTSTEMSKLLNFNEKQLVALRELEKLAFNFFGSSSSIKPLTLEEIEQIKSNLPPNLSLQRETIVVNALSLVGKVHYFWGGKSTSKGFDSRWGTPTVVTASGSKSTGTTRPFGLDCSGFITWVFLNSGLDVDTIGNTIGNGTYNQQANSIEIPRSAVLVGDIVFTPRIDHVGVVVSNENGVIMVAHCNSTNNNVTVDRAEDFNFVQFRRPAILVSDERKE